MINSYPYSKKDSYDVSSLYALVAIIFLACGSGMDGGGGIHVDPRDPYLEPTLPPENKADPLYGQQAWYFDAVHLPEAWKHGRGDRNLIVAVIDTGKVEHRDLNDKWVDGYDFAFGDTDASADDEERSFHHGAHVAGIIAATADNGIGIAGVCPECMIMPLRYTKANSDLSSDESGTPYYPTECLDSIIVNSGKCDSRDNLCILQERKRCTWNAKTEILARAIRYAAGFEVDDGTGKRVRATRPADVINISSGDKHFSERKGIPPLEVCAHSIALDGAIKASIRANVPIVVAAGNMDPFELVPSETRPGEMVMDRDNSNYLWAGCPVLSVAAVAADGDPETYTTLGKYISISAPGGSGQAVADPDKERSDGSGAFIECPKEYVEYESGVIGMHGVVSTWVTGALGTNNTVLYKKGKPCYRHLSGTSMAAPIIAGVVALMRAQDRKLSVDQLAQILDATATRIPCRYNGKTSCGSGMVDANAAVLAAKSPSATLSCMATSIGRFSCQSIQHFGLLPAGIRWLGIRNSVIDSGQDGSSTVNGSCASDAALSHVKVVIRDRLGREASAESQFPCTPGEHP